MMCVVHKQNGKKLLEIYNQVIGDCASCLAEFEDFTGGGRRLGDWPTKSEHRGLCILWGQTLEN